MKPLAIKNILVPIDFSIPSLRAIKPAVKLAQLTNAKITLLHVINALPTTAPTFYYSIPSIPAYEKNVTDVSNQQLNNLAEAIKSKGVENVNILSIKGKTDKEIVRISNKIKADLIMMGTHGISGFSEFFMGSNTFRVVHQATCPVLSIQKHVKTNVFKNIIVPFRDKPHAREKINYAIDIAKIYGATLHILGVDTEGTKSHLKKMNSEGEQIKNIIERFGVSCKLKIITEPYLADTILNYAIKKSADLIIVTSDMDKVSASEYFMGPFAQQIVNHSPVPILSIRPTFNTDMVDLRFY